MKDILKGVVAALGIILLVIGAIAVSAVLFGWLLMLAIGILAANGIVPATIGLFWDGAALGLILSTFVGLIVGSSRD